MRKRKSMKAAKPNLPENDIKKLVVSNRLSQSSVSWFEEKGVSLIFAPLLPKADSRLCHHVDLGICHADKNVLVVCPSVYHFFVDRGIEIIKGSSEPLTDHPADAPYNVCIIKDCALHNFKHTDPVLLDFLSTRYELADVKQAYTKCAVSVINEGFVITQDVGIAKALEKRGIEALLIEESKIRLDGYEYGFIGGASLMGSRNIWIVNGSLQKLDSWYNITRELEKRKIEIKCTNDEVPVDVGSFIVLCEEEDRYEKDD